MHGWIRCEFAEGQGELSIPKPGKPALIRSTRRLHQRKRYRSTSAWIWPSHPAATIAQPLAVYGDGKKCKLAFHRLWKGRDRATPLKLGESVKPWLLRIADLYSVAGLYFDPWQAAHLADELQAAGLRVVPVPQARWSRPKDTALHDMIADRRLVLYDHPDLRGAARFANAKELGNGLLFLCKSGGRGKIDALSLCGAQQLRQ